MGKGLIGKWLTPKDLLYSYTGFWIRQYGVCKAAEILEHGKVQNAEWSYTEVLRSQISRTMENTSSVGVRTWLQLMCCASVLELGVLISEWRFGEVECQSDRVTGWSVTSRKHDRAQTRSGRKDWGVDSNGGTR